MAKPVFKNWGRSWQLRVEGPADLEHVLSLPEALWAATSLPVSVLNCDPVFLRFLDADSDGRVRTDEYKDALAWLLRVLADRRNLGLAGETLVLEHLDRGDADGHRLCEAAGRLLRNTAGQADRLTLDGVRRIQARIASARFNGDGVVTPATAAGEDDDLAAFLTDAGAAVGTLPDAGGQPGIDRSLLDRFFREASACLAWRERGRLPPAGSPTPVMPFGPETAALYAPVAGLAAKLDQYFLQCAMVSFDGSAAGLMKLGPAEKESLDFADPEALGRRLAAAPLADPLPDRVLPLDPALVNPAWAREISLLAEKTLPAVLGRPVERLSEADWRLVESRFTAYRDWLGSRPAPGLEKIDPDRLAAFLSGDYRARALSLIERDEAVAGDLRLVRDLEKAILYQRWLLPLANNFVNFSELYDPTACSLFEAGTLVIEGREMTFTLRVRDRATHRRVAEGGHVCLLYVRVLPRPGVDEAPFEVAVAVTSGETSGLRIGRRGIFLATDGHTRDAEVVDIIQHPVSVAEFLKAPFRQAALFISRQVEKFGRTGQDQADRLIDGPGGPSSTSGIRDIMVGGGIALAALGSSLAYVTRALSEVRPVHVAAVLGGLAALIFLPNMVLGLVRMWRRNLGMVLEGVDCALNVRIRITTAMGRIFTRGPLLPEGSRREKPDSVTRAARLLSSVGACRPGFRVALLAALVLAFLAWLIGRLACPADWPLLP